ncbi:hypothetical protein SAMN06265374_2825 [Roseibium denhamense]|uniref:Uncharacterized protein n=1 Tax=Roseibium denhamense TaxID=76305 RepID=A0ABY1P5G6_9HYPH|nr:hypothetical protein SAMN06265374_2825 [Roseibium denhamense]
MDPRVKPEDDGARGEVLPNLHRLPSSSPRRGNVWGPTHDFTCRKTQRIRLDLWERVYPGSPLRCVRDDKGGAAQGR